ncbi:hypothetical protein KY285_029120 [Solanum tuberosum]|nr:hypothetical protein KY285_029120 [Solanum tuberosum]
MFLDAVNFSSAEGGSVISQVELARSSSSIEVILRSINSCHHALALVPAALVAADRLKILALTGLELGVAISQAHVSTILIERGCGSSASRHNQSEALVTGKRFSKGDPLENEQVSDLSKLGGRFCRKKNVFRRPPAGFEMDQVGHPFTTASPEALTLKEVPQAFKKERYTVSQYKSVQEGHAKRLPFFRVIPVKRNPISEVGSCLPASEYRLAEDATHQGDEKLCEVKEVWIGDVEDTLVEASSPIFFFRESETIEEFPSVRCGKGAFGDICCCEFLPKNPLGLPAGKYVVKSFRPRSIESYVGELYYLKELQYKFIPKLIGYGHDGGVRCHLIMKYYSGGSLRQKIDGLKYQHALTILIDVFDGLHLIHAHCEHHRIVHADLKPENIVLDEEWREALCDFGLTGEVFRKKAVWMSRYDERPKRREIRPEYMEKTSYGSQESEIYALGLIMIEVLTKEPIDAVELAESVTGKMQSKESLLTMIRDEIKLSGCNYGRAKDLLLLALCCIRSKRKDRPRAYEASYELRKIQDSRNQFLLTLWDDSREIEGTELEALMENGKDFPVILGRNIGVFGYQEEERELTRRIYFTDATQTLTLWSTIPTLILLDKERNVKSSLPYMGQFMHTRREHQLRLFGEYVMILPDLRHDWKLLYVTGRGRGDWRSPGMKGGYGMSGWGGGTSGRNFGIELEFTLPSYNFTYLELDNNQLTGPVPS